MKQIQCFEGDGVDRSTAQTVDEAVGEMVGQLGEREVAYIKTSSLEHLLSLHHSFGRNLRNHFKLWSNPALVEDAKRRADWRPSSVPGLGEFSADEASSCIIRELKRRLDG